MDALIVATLIVFLVALSLPTLRELMSPAGKTPP